MRTSLAAIVLSFATMGANAAPVIETAPLPAFGAISEFSRAEVYDKPDANSRKYELRSARFIAKGKEEKWVTLERLCAAGSDCVERTYYMQLDFYVNYANQTRQTITGILAVPFKFHATDHNTTAGTTIGGYVGYQWYKMASDISIAPIVSGGLALVPQKAATIETKADTPPADGTTLTGVSAALGLIGTAHNDFQFGLLVGWDWVGKDKNYKYEGKPWISFAVGYKFSGP
jgi:hypothetical protein